MRRKQRPSSANLRASRSDHSTRAFARMLMAPWMYTLARRHPPGRRPIGYIPHRGRIGGLGFVFMARSKHSSIRHGSCPILSESEFEFGSLNEPSKPASRMSAFGNKGTYRGRCSHVRFGSEGDMARPPPPYQPVADDAVDGACSAASKTIDWSRQS